MSNRLRIFRIGYQPSETPGVLPEVKATDSAHAYRMGIEQFPNSISQWLWVIDANPGSLSYGSQTMLGNPNFDSAKAQKFQLERQLSEIQKELGITQEAADKHSEANSDRIVKSKDDALGILGLVEPFDESQLVTAFREAMKRNHPDRVADMSPEIRQLAERRTKEINAALAYLKR